jgi:hypothetical protein
MPNANFWISKRHDSSKSFLESVNHHLEIDKTELES